MKIGTAPGITACSATIALGKPNELQCPINQTTRHKSEQDPHRGKKSEVDYFHGAWQGFYYH